MIIQYPSLYCIVILLLYCRDCYQTCFSFLFSFNEIFIINFGLFDRLNSLFENLCFQQRFNIQMWWWLTCFGQHSYKLDCNNPKQYKLHSLLHFIQHSEVTVIVDRVYDFMEVIKHFKCLPLWMITQILMLILQFQCRKEQKKLKNKSG